VRRYRKDVGVMESWSFGIMRIARQFQRCCRPERRRVVGFGWSSVVRCEPQVKADTKRSADTVSRSETGAPFAWSAGFSPLQRRRNQCVPSYFTQHRVWKLMRHDCRGRHSLLRASVLIPEQLDEAGALRLVLRTQPRSGRFVRSRRCIAPLLHYSAAPLLHESITPPSVP
jgi:hypothetical protein